MQRLSEVVDFEVLLIRDEALANQAGAGALIVRDRALAAQLPSGATQARLRAWVQIRRATEPDLPGERARGVVAVMGWILVALGVAVGSGAAAALLAYDGRSPVNVLAWLLYTAAIPFAFVLILALGLLIPKGWFPQAGAGQALVAAVLEPLLRRLPEGPGWVRALFGRTSRGRATLERWLLVILTQVFSIGLLGAALVTLVVKVAITDLTFSWSTTLDLSDREVTQIVHAVALPWAELYADAVPDEAAVAKSNYRRFVERFRDTANRSAVEVALGATWWRYCAAALITYGLLPRLLFLVLGWLQWKRALARWPDPRRPEVKALLDRFEGSGGTFSERLPRPSEEPNLDPRERHGEASRSQSATSEPEAAQTKEIPVEMGLTVAWGEAASQPALAAEVLSEAPERLLSAGTDLDLAAEQAVLSKAAELRSSVTVLMPLSEPPIEDVLSFLRELRTVSTTVRLVPIQRHEEGWERAELTPPWTRALARLRGVEGPTP